MNWLKRQIERVPLSVRRDAGFFLFVCALGAVAGMIVYLLV